MDSGIVLWSWDTEDASSTPPDGRVVVCQPGIHELNRGMRLVSDAALMGKGRIFVTPLFDARGWAARFPCGLIPAAYIERQAQLADIRALWALGAAQKALALCPREELDLVGPGALLRCDQCGAHGAADRGPGDVCPHSADPTCSCDGVLAAQVSLVVILPPAARTCARCEGAGSRKPTCAESGCEEGGEHYCFARPCGDCKATGRVEPWPLHPEWVRSIIAQCRAAEIPYAFLGWGPFMPESEYPIQVSSGRKEAWCRSGCKGPMPMPEGEEELWWRDGTITDWGAMDEDGAYVSTWTGWRTSARFVRVGAERAGRTIDGAEAVDLGALFTYEARAAKEARKP